MRYGRNPNAFPYWQRQVGMVDAINTALQQVQGEVVDAELKTSRGRQIFEIEIVAGDGMKYEVKVDRNTGEVIQVELD